MTEMGVDKFYKNHDWIYQVIEHLEFNNGTQTIIETAGPMAELLVQEMPEVEYATATTILCDGIKMWFK